MPAAQLDDHVVQPAPRPSVSQPLALNFPEGHADVPVAQLLQVLVPAPVHVPVHSDTVPLTVLIAVAWNVPGSHAVQPMLVVELPGAE